MTELGDTEGILVIDETAFPKQGRHSVRVARQYCGTLGKIANCQVGVFLGFASSKGRAGIDHALFVPRQWIEDPDRRREAGIPEETEYSTKPALALEMMERALDAGVLAAWVVGDEVYGSDGKLRRALEARGQAYVLAVCGNEGRPPGRPSARLGSCASRIWWLACPRMHGSVSVVVRRLRVRASTTGHPNPQVLRK